MTSKQWIQCIMGASAYIVWACLVKSGDAPMEAFVTFNVSIVTAVAALALRDMK